MSCQGITIKTTLANASNDLLGSQWDELLSKQPTPNPTSSATWLRATMELDKSATPLIITAEHQGKLVGAGAFQVEKTSGFRVARWLGGTGRPAITPDLLIDPKYDEVADMLVKQLLKECDVASLGASRVSGHLGQAIDDNNFKGVQQATDEAWIVDLSSLTMEKLKKKNAARLRRAERGGAACSCNTYTDVKDIAPALARLFALHQSRWKGRNDISRFSGNDFYRSWTRSLVSEMAQRNQVRIIEVLENGEPAAMILGLLFGRGALFHTPAVNPDSTLRGAGHVAMQAWVEAAQAAGAEVMNLGRGSGEPQGPKAALGPIKQECKIFKISRKPILRAALKSAEAARLWRAKR